MQRQVSEVDSARSDELFKLSKLRNTRRLSALRENQPGSWTLPMADTCLRLYCPHGNTPSGYTSER